MLNGACTVASVLMRLALIVTPSVALAAPYTVPANGDVVGAAVVVSATAEETLLDIGRRFDLGYHEMQRANPNVDLWVPEDGARVRLPLQFVLPDTPRRGVVLNLPEYRLYYFERRGDGTLVTTHPISIGRMDWETPLGVTSVVAKAKNPAWYPPQSVKEEHAADGDPLPNVVPPGPDNPLGPRALRLGLPGYLIHGTNRPAGVGMRVTHGCLRLYPEDVEALYERVSVGTPVRIVNQPVKAGWYGAELLLEVHPQLSEAQPEAAVDNDGKVAVLAAAEPDTKTQADAADEAVPELALDAPAESLLTAATRALVAATTERPADIDWTAVDAAVAAASGEAVVVGRVFVAPSVAPADAPPEKPSAP